MKFDLHHLGWKAFQDLCGSILSEVLGQTFQQFSDSHDGGRDGAFGGTWHNQKTEEFTGPFTAQCKFTAKANAKLTLAYLNDEIQKAKRLAKSGLAETYLLLTNYELTGTGEEELRREFLNITGIRHFAAYGSEWICGKIRESPRLRMVVPRLYGLGDLSQILDERAYAQAKEILSSMGEDLSKFVITDAHRKSTKALLQHGFVLLLGEPASGKSTIAAALSVAATDEWGCRVAKVRSAQELVKHFNPHEKQLFWIDDAFGPTQLDASLTTEWNSAFPHMTAALKCGSRIIFTSRDYIYRSAIPFLKTSSFPCLTESQVIIEVEALTVPERNQILYNHLKLGRQPVKFRKGIKPFLEPIASLTQFKPEIARRLGDPLFTKGLSLTQPDLRNFVERPVEHLLEVIRTLDAANRAAIGIIFMHGGSLPSPLKLTSEESRAIELIGADIAGVRQALGALNESLLLRVHEAGRFRWRFKHPTVRDAYAALVASDPELMDIYLAGSPADRLLGEISCGDVGLEGVRVIVPVERYGTIIDRLSQWSPKDINERSRFHYFLARRCDATFLRAYVSKYPDFPRKLHVMSYLEAVSDVNVICRLHEFGILPEDVRRRTIEMIEGLAVETPDSGFLIPRIRAIFTQKEIDHVLNSVKTGLIDNLERTVENWESNFSYEEGEDPEVHFETLTDTLRRYRDALGSESRSSEKIGDALGKIDDIIEILRENAPPERDHDDYEGSNLFTESHSERSVFEDIDE